MDDELGLEDILNIVKTAVPAADLAASVVQLALKLVPHEALQAALTAQGRARADAIADIAEASRFSKEP